ncbi:hypothetical protein [Roseobacter sp. MH60115]|uniref:hypothetical protein n=1 Tax=Roseobacter sp. MH60115 TaxID=2785324 RepID=UPI001E2E1A8F|nr:hypothetical protein [Roseobacter sp. MH60115]
MYQLSLLDQAYVLFAIIKDCITIIQKPIIDVFIPNPNLGRILVERALLFVAIFTLDRTDDDFSPLNSSCKYVADLLPMFLLLSAHLRRINTMQAQRFIIQGDIEAKVDVGPECISVIYADYLGRVLIQAAVVNAGLCPWSE